MAVPTGLLASYVQNPSDASTVLNQAFIVGSAFTTADPVYCPIDSVVILDSTGANYTGSCVHVASLGLTNDTQYGGIFCTETGL